MKRGLLVFCAFLVVSGGTGVYTSGGDPAAPVAAGGGYWLCHAAGLWRECNKEGENCAEKLSEGLGSSADRGAASAAGVAMCQEHLDRMVEIAALGGVSGASRACAADGCQWIEQ